MDDMLDAGRDQDVFFSSAIVAGKATAVASAFNRGTFDPGAFDPCAFDLGGTVRREVIPRLHAALCAKSSPPRRMVHDTPSPLAEDVPAFAIKLLSADAEGVDALIEALRRQGRSLDTIYLDLLAPVACHLRDLWSDDLCGLADVTIAISNLGGILRRFAADFHAEAAARENGSRILLVSPSDSRCDAGLTNFGLMLLSEFFRREGWGAWIDRDLTCERFRETLVGQWFDLVEVVATSDKQLDEIATGIKAIRRGSPNPAIGVIVCGQIFVDRPEFVRLVGADLVATDPMSSLLLARRHVAADLVGAPPVRIATPATNEQIADRMRRARLS